MRQCLACGREFPAPTGRGRPPTTCSAVCARRRKNSQHQQWRQRIQGRDVPEHLHGTPTGATDYGCRCSRCRKWWREYQQARRKTLREAAKGR